MQDYLSMDGRVYRIRFRGKLCTDNRTLSFESFCARLIPSFKIKLNPQFDYYLVAYQSALDPIMLQSK